MTLILVQKILVKYCFLCVSHFQVRTLKVGLVENDKNVGDHILCGKMFGLEQMVKITTYEYPKGYHLQDGTDLFAIAGVKECEEDTWMNMTTRSISVKYWDKRPDGTACSMVERSASESDRFFTV